MKSNPGRRSAIGAVLGFAVAAGACGTVRADVLDQHNEGPLSGGTSVGVIGTAVDQSAAQTITVGLTGTLDRVEMYIYAGATLTSPLVLEVRPVTDGAPDATTVLASQQVLPTTFGLQWVSFDLGDANLSVEASQPLALVLRSAQDLSHGEYDAEGTHEQYSGGGGFYRSFSGPWMPLSDYDLEFRTYVTPGSSCGSADFNHDGDTATDADIEDFFACIAGNCCASCGSADFNGDGDVATDADIEAFFRVLAGGSC